MEPWDKYLNNLPIEEVQQLDSDYGKYFVEGIKHSTPLQRFAITQIVYYLFDSSHSDRDIIPRNDEDLQYALRRPARIFQIGMEKKPEDIVGILKCINDWASDCCKGSEYGLISFLDELSKYSWRLDYDEEDFEDVQSKLVGPDWSGPPPGSWSWPF